MRLVNLIILFTTTLLVSCTNNHDNLQSNNLLLARLHQAVDPVRNLRQGYKVIDLADLTDFAWDSVYFFMGETSSEEISKRISIDWDGPDVPNLHRRLLFVHEGSVVSYVDCNQEKILDKNGIIHLDFTILLGTCISTGSKPLVIARRHSKCFVFRHCDSGQQTFYLVPLECLPDFEDRIKEGCKKSQQPKRKRTAEPLQR